MEAQELLESAILAEHMTRAALEFESARLQTRIGVAAFDLGRYGDALDLLKRAAVTLQMARRHEQAAWAMSFLGQLYTAIGMYELAEFTLQSAVALFGDEKANLGIRGYLRALLGCVYLKWEPARLPDAKAHLRQAMEETTASGFLPTRPLVELHCVQLHLAEGGPEALDHANELLSHVETFGWARSDIALATMRSRVALARHSVEEAVALSTRAVEDLERRGGAIAATRSEEVFLNHAKALYAAGSDAAPRFGARAVQIVEAKAQSLNDPVHVRSFRERVRLSVEILAWQASAPVCPARTSR